MGKAMDLKAHIPDHILATLQALTVVLVLVYLLAPDREEEQSIEITSAAPSYYEHWRWKTSNEFDVDGELERLRLDDYERDQKIRRLLREEKYQEARSHLLEIAAASVLQDNQARLVDTMLLLGEVAIHQQELAAAEIYLQEALHQTIEQDDVIGTGRCYQLLGQLNIRARELARLASFTHDSLWQARNAISRGVYHGVEDSLKQVVDESVAIRRYGAAAGAYETMATLYDRLHDRYQAQLARVEAARLYAATGQVPHVRRLMEGLDEEYLTADQYRQLQLEIEAELQAHHQDLKQTTQARDYQMLYHHYLRRGEVERAWQFRIKSSQTLANTSDRALFQRQADVIGVLYNSNFAMDRARQYLNKAGAIYDEQNAPELLEETRNLETLIY